MFSGIGGFELPLQELGCKCVGYSEIDKYAIQVFDHKFNCMNYGDAKQLDTKLLPDFDLLCAGFPCQDFSIGGKRRGLKENGVVTRSGLFGEILRVLKAKKPKYFLLENVKGMLNFKNKDDKKYAFDAMMKSLADIGYSLDFRIFNSKDFGLAQNRERVIIFGALNKLVKESIVDKVKKRLSDGGVNIFDSFLSSIESEDKVTLNQILQKNVQSKYFVNKPIKIKKVPRAGDIKCIGIIYESIKVKGNYFPRERVFSTDGISRALTTSYSHQPMYKIGKKIRKLTPMETERLHGFPDDWTKWGKENGKKIEIPELKRYSLTGNAVSVPVIKKIGERLLRWLK